MKKRILSILPVVLILFLTTVPSFAKQTAQPDSAAVDYAAMDDAELAYCDLEAAPQAWKDAILTARNQIIYSKSWTVDGQVSVIYPDGIKYTAPEFSDLFPGWDVPTTPITPEMKVVIDMIRARNK